MTIPKAVAASVFSGLLSWAALASGQTGTVRDGVFTREQAGRGQKEYQVFCASCHAADLAGTNSGDNGAPPLRGDHFMEGSDANALFTLISQRMPLDAPAALSEQQYLDILAYVFQENGFPPGSEELKADVERLKQIRILRPVAASVPDRRSDR